MKRKVIILGAPSVGMSILPPSSTHSLDSTRKTKLMIRQDIIDQTIYPTAIVCWGILPNDRTDGKETYHVWWDWLRLWNHRHRRSGMSPLPFTFPASLLLRLSPLLIPFFASPLSMMTHWRSGRIHIIPNEIRKRSPRIRSSLLYKFSTIIRHDPNYSRQDSRILIRSGYANCPCWSEGWFEWREVSPLFFSRRDDANDIDESHLPRDRLWLRNWRLVSSSLPLRTIPMSVGHLSTSPFPPYIHTSAWETLMVHEYPSIPSDTGSFCILAPLRRPSTIYNKNTLTSRQNVQCLMRRDAEAMESSSREEEDRLVLWMGQLD